MFIDIENSLKEIEARYIGVTLNIQGLSKKFPDLVQMLQEEKTRFEVRIDGFCYTVTLTDSWVQTLIVVFFLIFCFIARVGIL